MSVSVCHRLSPSFPPPLLWCHVIESTFHFALSLHNLSFDFCFCLGFYYSSFYLLACLWLDKMTLVKCFRENINPCVEALISHYYYYSTFIIIIVIIIREWMVLKNLRKIFIVTLIFYKLLILIPSVFKIKRKKNNFYLKLYFFYF